MPESRTSRGTSVSTVLARRLGSELLRLREAVGLKQPHAAEALGVSVAKVAKVERGWVPVRDLDIKALCELYETRDPKTVASLLALAKADRDRRKAKGWWKQFPELGTQVEYAALEDVAAQVRTQQLNVVPGLLQTADHARALAVGCEAWSGPDEVERVVQARLARQQRLDGANPLQLWAVIAEGVLHQQVGGPSTMRAQLTHLLKLTERPNIKVQILPFTSGAHAGLGGAFNILSFAEPGALDVVYLDTPASSLWVESEQDAARHTTIFEHVVRNSLPPTDSQSLIRRALKEL
ncbi:helix-turn-helix domain-containing protein [Streptomyces paludis]|uniref:helix-turn-helix domain-containing protein n=1 Tax=Streptomyces paludis TaxID=2282738 RepID=UPI001E2F233D|nr:helix-turn-helix transcriptional regulator [Streptomyces paludis]